MMLLRSTFSRNASRALQSNGLRGMASAVTPGPRYDVSEAAGVKVANRDVVGATGSLVLVAKAGPRYQPFPGFSEALESFAFKVRSSYPIGLLLHHITWGRSTTNHYVTIDSLHSNGRRCGSLGRLNCWAVRFPRHIRARTSSSRPSSSRTIFHTSPSCWPKLRPKPSSQVSGGMWAMIIKCASNSFHQPMN